MIQPTFCRRLFVVFAFFGAVLPAAAAAPALPPLQRAATDEAEWRRLVLPNGLRVLLASDRRFNKSAAALVVNVGQIDDPPDSEGLAHFLEHMLFLGTEKYPSEDEYRRFMRSNGGYNNAYTASDHTNYRFEVRHEALPEALDRFAQFFIAPRFDPRFTAREVNAVHNEAMRHLQNDQRRLTGVRRELYAAGSGETKFSTGNKDTLSRATPEAVRSFYERHYGAERMALAITGRAPLDELERLARSAFSAVPRRDLAPVKREATFLPRRPLLRLAFVEPVKEVRQLQFEFVAPPTRPDFASHPARLVGELLRHAGEGSLLARLKGEGLANEVAADLWERTGDYGSYFVTIDLTPEGQRRYERVAALFFAYLEHLRRSPFPAGLYDELAQVGRLHEAYGDRGEGADLAARLANQALFYPLEVAERAGRAWGPPDEAAYRRLLSALVPENTIAALQAKGVATDRRERIYGTAYSYREDAGAAFAALKSPPADARFALPAPNRFLPQATPLLAEQPVVLIDEPGLVLHYAADHEFQRPEAALVVRFVPVREGAGTEAAALLALWSRCLRDALDADFADARAAGVAITSELTLEGLKFSVTGYGDSAARFARHLAGRLRGFTLPPERFAAVKEAALRSLVSHAQTEAFALARERRDAVSREVAALPDQLLAPTQAATWPDVQAFGRRLLARGKLEVLVYGHLPPAAAVSTARALASALGAAPAPEATLLRRRHLEIAAGENVVDAGRIEGVNSAYLADYLLGDDSPRTQVAAMLAAAVISPAYFSELRTRQQLGYIVSAGAGVSTRQRYLGFVIQSSEYASDELRRRSEQFIATFGERVGALSAAEWATLKAGVRSQLDVQPKSIAERAERDFHLAYTLGGEWERRRQALAALDAMTQDELRQWLDAALGTTARRRTVLLDAARHPPRAAGVASFTDRDAWKRGREFR